MNNLEIDMLGDSHQQQLYLRVFLQALYSDSLVEYEDLLELVGYYVTLGKANEN